MVTRVIRRNITDQLLQALARTPVALINGARQTGKSTLVQSREVADEHSRQYLTFDDPGMLAAARRGISQHKWIFSQILWKITILDARWSAPEQPA